MWFIPLIIGVALQVVAYLLQPKAKKSKPQEVKDMDSPIADTGTPIIVVFGSVTVTGINLLWFGDKQKHVYQVRT